MMDSTVNSCGTAVQQDEEEKADSGDGDGYSSGSDRSIEADDVGGCVRSNSELNCHKNQTESVRSRRKRRHGSHGTRRHKGGNRHKYKGYQPYPSKDDVELQLKRQSLELKEKENAAAFVRHEGAAGQFVTFPIAPFNSTQFLMDEHCDSSTSDLHKSASISVLNVCSPQDIRLHSVPSTPVELSHETITFEKKDKEFTDFFTTAHAESLQSLPKAELVKHYINLEEKIAALQKKVAENQKQQDDNDLYSKVCRHLVDKTCDSICNSDANSLSSTNEEFVDLSVVNQPSICVGEPEALGKSEAVSHFSEDFKDKSADGSSS